MAAVYTLWHQADFGGLSITSNCRLHYSSTFVGFFP